MPGAEQIEAQQACFRRPRRVLESLSAGPIVPDSSPPAYRGKDVPLWRPTDDSTDDAELMTRKCVVQRPARQVHWRVPQLREMAILRSEAVGYGRGIEMSSQGISR